MDTEQDNDVGIDPLEPFVTATAAEIAYAEELLRRIELRYLNRPAEARVVDSEAASAD
jgi:hypothetical protein